MDDRLGKAAKRIEKQIEILQVKEEVLMNLEASEKFLYSNLYLATKGTVAEREAKVESSEEWLTYKKALKDAKVSCNRERRMYELLLRAGDWEYGTFKIESENIKRQRGT